MGRKPQKGCLFRASHDLASLPKLLLNPLVAHHCASEIRTAITQLEKNH